MKKRLLVLASVALSIGLLSQLPEADAQKTKGKTRAATTKQLMKGLVSANCGALKKAIDAETADWDEITLRAALLNEAGYFLMDDGRCPDAEWAKGAKAVQKASADLLASAEKQDAAAVKAAFAQLTGEGCGTCHKAHKK